MTQKAYRIIEWEAAHSSSLTRRHKSLKWITCTTAPPSPALAWLQSQRGGMAALGVYIRLAEFAGTLPIRGLLASRAKPYTVAELAALIECPLPALKQGVKMLTAKGPAPWHPYLDLIPFPPDDGLVETTIDAEGEIVSRVILPASKDCATAQSSAQSSDCAAAQPMVALEQDLDLDLEEITNQARARAIAAFERLVGRQVTTGQISQIDRFVGTLPNLIAIGGLDVGVWEVVDRACGDGIAKGNRPSTVPAALKLIGEIVERCIRDGCWPGVFPPREKPGFRPANVKLGVARAG